jgi:hypothetical protein
MLFTLKEAEPATSTVIKKWLARQDRLEPVFNLYFGTLYHPSLYLEVRFLAFAQAIETYDYRRRRKPGKKTLAKRTHDVLRQCRRVAKRIVGDDTEAFVVDFKNARNYYTHYDPKLEKKAASGTLAVAHRSAGGDHRDVSALPARLRLPNHRGDPRARWSLLRDPTP